jgi:hypothetical protein
MISILTKHAPFQPVQAPRGVAGGDDLLPPSPDRRATTYGEYSIPSTVEAVDVADAATYTRQRGSRCVYS